MIKVVIIKYLWIHESQKFDNIKYNDTESTISQWRIIKHHPTLISKRNIATIIIGFRRPKSLLLISNNNERRIWNKSWYNQQSWASSPSCLTQGRSNIWRKWNFRRKQSLLWKLCYSRLMFRPQRGVLQKKWVSHIHWKDYVGTT